jgi:hypothetical protein
MLSLGDESQFEIFRSTFFGNFKRDKRRMTSLTVATDGMLKPELVMRLATRLNFS